MIDIDLVQEYERTEEALKLIDDAETLGEPGLVDEAIVRVQVAQVRVLIHAAACLSDIAAHLGLDTR